MYLTAFLGGLALIAVCITAAFLNFPEALALVPPALLCTVIGIIGLKEQNKKE